MNKRAFAFILLNVLVYLVLRGQDPCQIYIIYSSEQYLETVRQDSVKKIVDLQKMIPGIRLDIRYATSNNFTHKKIYPAARAFMRIQPARVLQKIQKELNLRGLGLKIYDAYRPYAATKLFWKLVHDTAYVASPLRGSRHNRGCAVDVSLIDLKTGRELLMPTPFDEFSPRAGATYRDLPAEAIRNRDTLIHLMTRNGFTVYPSEWWHYDYSGWNDYEIMDLSFRDLDRISLSPSVSLSPRKQH